jgi:hypothetical protein
VPILPIDQQPAGTRRRDRIEAGADAAEGAPNETPRTRLSLRRPHLALLGLLQKCPWFGWAVWAVVVAAVLVRMHPRRFGPAFGFYFEYASKLWAEQPLYDPSSLGDVNYWPVSLLLFVPLLPLDPTLAASVSFAIFAALLTYAAIVFTRALLDDRPGTIWIAGLLLAVNIWPGWYGFKYVQLLIPMTAATMLASTAMMRARWTVASLWLAVALVAKPLALVMVLLTGVLVPRMRLLLLAGVVAGFALPFVFLHWDYVIGQYQALGLKLWAVTTAPPGEWIWQSDYTTLLRAFGIALPGKMGFAIRLVAAVGTLWLAWRVRGTGDRKAFALALLLLSGLYITLFGPRNENISYLAVTPALSAVAFLILLRDVSDFRGWLLILACLALGIVVRVPIDVVTKPAITLIAYVWVAVQMTQPQRWCALTSGALSSDAAPKIGAPSAVS